ncbi:hypothetical protein [Tahibacter caeni]|uniref:hypothetical protein n=1 Tax=Tahibacter caeni TaxID=1453545 RepID=UPI00214915A3|nr:hypothetical protein [Tahibacter caeni]
MIVERGGDVAAALSAIDGRSAGWRLRQFRRVTTMCFFAFRGEFGACRAVLLRESRGLKWRGAGSPDFVSLVGSVMPNRRAIQNRSFTGK